MMRPTSARRRTAALAALLLGAGLALSACGDDGDSSSAGGTSPGKGKAECEGLTSYGDLTGKTVKVYTSIVSPESTSQKNSYKLFTTCTGAKIAYEGSKEFEAQLVVRVKSGNPPDIAYVPQPGLLGTLVKDTGKVVEAPKGTTANVDKFWGEDWKKYGTVDGKFYAAPLGANLKSFVWYSPKTFAKNGWAVPTTWDQMTGLSEKIASSGMKPWCYGVESGDATGWPLTDFLEDAVLRDSGPDAYDDWVNHKVPFNDPTIAASLDRVGKILKNDQFVNGGIGDVKSIATTPWTDGGFPILKDKCAMMRQANFYAANWPKGTDVSENGDVFAFYLPATNEKYGKPVVGGGEFVTAFSDRPEVQAFQNYLSSDTWANEKAKATPDGGWVTANTGLDINNIVSPIDKLSATVFQDKNAVFRFDGSDQMPGAVGAGSFWKEMVSWITGQSTTKTLDNIEASWK
jgi:alpha-glucoside transport system substrate-binding protein